MHPPEPREAQLHLGGGSELEEPQDVHVIGVGRGEGQAEHMYPDLLWNLLRTPTISLAEVNTTRFLFGPPNATSSERASCSRPIM